MKTMAIRLEEEVSAQLTVLAQLEDSSVAELIREAITGLIERKKSEGNLAGRAESILAAIDRDAAERRGAIEALFGGEPAVETKPPRGRRASSAD